tara:strand:+ start:320 stop:559 length:240 start_codon:yes stop_codon:yes gene_type:complete
LDAKNLSKSVYVFNQCLSVVVACFPRRPRLPAAALVEKHNVEELRIEIAPVIGVDLTAGPTVQKYYRVPSLLTATFNVD